MYQKVEICGINTAKLPILTEKEKKRLIAKAHDGDTDARRQMIEGNLRLVLSVVQKFSQRGENMDDLFQVGCIGLMKAIDHFDPSLEVRFSTYGVPMIVGEIRRFLRDNNSVRVSRSVRDIAYKALGAREALEKELGYEPNITQISEHLGMSTRMVSLAMESVIEPVSLYEPIYSDGGDTIFVMDQVSDNSSEDSWISGIQFRENVRALTPREKHIMQLRYFSGKTQMEVAQEVGVSQAQVSRLEKSAMKQIKSGESEL